MSRKAYTTIFLLLSLTLVSAFVLQGLWVYNALKVAHEEVDRNTQKAFDRLEEELSLRGKIGHMKERLVVRNERMSGTFTKHLNLSVGGDSLFNEKHMQVFNIEELHTPVHPERIHAGPGKFVVLDSERTAKGFNKRMIISHSIAGDSACVAGEIDSLMSRMLVELKEMDATPVSRLSKDSLYQLIRSALNRQGIYASFQFAFKSGKKNSILKRSEGFDTTLQEKKTYVLNADNLAVIKNGDKILLQYDSQARLVFARLKTLLVFSGILALVIICAFLFTIRLLHRQKKLAEIKNDFINNMTHELKTPIASIAVASGALKNEKVLSDPEKIKYYTTVVKSENEKMMRNVERVLQLAMTEGENFRPQMVNVNLNDVIEKSFAALRLLADEKNILLKTDLAAHLRAVKGNADSLEGCVTNIIENALKYSAPESTVSVSTFNDGSYVKLKVADQGIGMSKEEVKRIFEKFYRAQGGDIHDVKGFGIGLSYANNVLKAHQAEIAVESSPGKGSTFELTFKAI